MASNVLDANDAILAGQAFAEECFREFEKEWLEPMMKLDLKMLWASMPAAMKEKMRKENPEQYEQVEKYLKQVE